MAGAHTVIAKHLPYLVTGQVHGMRFVKLTGDQSVIECSVLGEEALGVAQTDVLTSNWQGINEVTGGKGTDVVTDGIVFVQAGGTINRGDFVATKADGTAVAAATGNIKLGRAMAGAVINDWFPVYLLEWPAHVAMP